MKINLIMIVLSVILFSCSDVIDNQDETVESGEAKIRIKLDNIGSVGKVRAINLQKLFITLEADNEEIVKDTFVLDANGAQSITQSYDLASLKKWTLTAISKDVNDSIVHNGVDSFSVEPKKTTTVKLDLSSKYSMLVANYFPIRDSVTRCELLLDNNLVGTSSFTKQSILGDTVTVNYDYMSSTPTGVQHHIKLDVYGDMWLIDTLLYTGDTLVNVISGQNTSYDVTLKWVGPGLPPNGKAEIQVVLGSIGTTKINGEIEDTTIGNFDGHSGNFVDERDGTKYKWVKIGDQIWMGENLKYDPGYDTYVSDINYGRRYRWGVAQSVAPTGWRLPTNDDWSELITYVESLGYVGQLGKVLKGKPPVWNGIDLFGFNMLQAGYHGDGSAKAINGGYTMFWNQGTVAGFGRRMRFDNTDGMHLNYSGKSYYFSVRCIKE